MTLMVLKSFALSQNSACISCHLIRLFCFMFDYAAIWFYNGKMDFPSRFFHRRRTREEREVNITVNMCQAFPVACCIGMLCMVLTHFDMGIDFAADIENVIIRQV